MKRKRIWLFICIIFVICTASVAWADIPDEIYSYEHYDKYRQIRYWAKKHVSVRDYNYDSGDAKYLNLCSKDPNNPTGDITNQEIVAHFNKEFVRLIQGKKEFHDVEKGTDERFMEFLTKHREAENKFELFQAREEARINALYGPNPAAIFCIIRISRRDFPILYEMKTSIVADKKLWNRGGLEESKLGYSTPEHIVKELKRSITAQLEELVKELDKINSAKKDKKQKTSEQSSNR